jgi:hypothetical protein
MAINPLLVLPIISLVVSTGTLLWLAVLNNRTRRRREMRSTSDVLADLQSRIPREALKPGDLDQ